MLGASAAAADQGKIPQAQAGYRNTPKGANRCESCMQFQPPSACKVVDGAVSANGSCNLFAPRPK